MSFGNLHLLKDFVGVAEKVGLCFLPFVKLADAKKRANFTNLKRGFYLMMLQNFGEFLFHDCCTKIYFPRLLQLAVKLH